MKNERNPIQSLVKSSYNAQESFTTKAHIKSYAEYLKIWQYSISSPLQFWKEQAQNELIWSKNFSKVYSFKDNYHRWFEDGELNACYNCVDRHLPLRGEKTAIICENEKGDVTKISYNQLYKKILCFSSYLQTLSLESDAVITFYMPMTIELVVAILSCARIGIMHNVVFAGFSSEALKERIIHSNSKIIITCDATIRKNKVLALKNIVDEACKDNSNVDKIIVVQKENIKINMEKSRDIWWHDAMQQNDDSLKKPQSFLAEKPLFMLYTSGSTGKPKGLVHTTAGYLLSTKISTRYIFDLHDDDIFWCTADIGWITGHSYVIYGPLANGSTIFMYDGAPSIPHWGRFWSMIEKHKITKLYTAPTAIRSFMKEGESWPQKFDLSSLKLLATVGEAINPKTWLWFYKHIGRQKCPIVDTWWQTETGSIMIAGIPGAIAQKPGSASLPFFGVDPDILSPQGKSIPQEQSGYLVIKQAHPSMARTIYKDHKRFTEQYWSTFPNKYFTQDGACRDKDDYFWILGRVDDVINVSGHRISTVEIESTLVAHTNIIEAAVVGKSHSIKGMSICAFVVNDKQSHEETSFISNLKTYIREKIGALAVPDHIYIIPSLPKTRSGKIMRRLLRDIVEGKEPQGDLSTIEESTILNLISKKTRKETLASPVIS